MIKLARYLKPYIAVAIVALVLLFTQAMLDLSLPNMMSDIVNVGIQKGGITEQAPKAITKNGLELMSAFCTEGDKALMASYYQPIDKSAMNADLYKKITKEFPNSEAQSALYLTNATNEINTAFARAGYAFITFVKDNASANSEHTNGEGAVAALDMAKLEAMLPMLSQVPPEKIDAAISVAAATPEAMLGQSSAVFIKSIYTQLGANTASIQNNYILITGLKMLGFSLLLCAAAVSVGLLASRMGAGVARDLRRDVFKKVSTFTSAELDHFSTASLITRTTNDITQIQGFLTMGLRIMCFAPIMGIGGTIMALSKSSGMAWIIVLAVILIFCIIGTIFAIAMPRFTKMQQLVDKLNLVSREGLSGMMVIRAFNTQKFEENRFDKANKDLSSNSMFIFSAVSLMMPIMNLILNGICLLIVWIGGKQIAQSGMQVGDMMAFMQYAMQIMMSFLMISMMFIMLPRASVSGKRISEVLDSESSVKDPVSPKHLPKEIHGDIAFNDVCFHYEGADENVLDHIDFTARAGETTAFIGSTGSGKSTLINLIPRFYDVTAGSITIDGVDIRDITQHELREAIGYVPQKGMLFSGDIASNLRLGNNEASDELLRNASETAQASEFIDELDEGFASEISQGGTNVSGGQRQRLSIARALVKKAPIYIFDDTFSALDFKTDAALREALGTYTGGASVLIVAQRISTIVHSQQIIVLDEGHIVGKGTHEELMNNCETYREIAASQLPKEELEQWEK
ncbi:MAG: ABC transporter ATP-binding protein [Oscillospiraceae bacterium]